MMLIGWFIYDFYQLCGVQSQKEHSSRSIKSQLNNYDDEKEQPLLSGYKKDKLGRKYTLNEFDRGL
jgi:hypothetical protein